MNNMNTGTNNERPAMYFIVTLPGLARHSFVTRNEALDFLAETMEPATFTDDTGYTTLHINGKLDRKATDIFNTFAGV